jgi:prolyl-tRNA editing enzyme YbaK/EbsC (Cys-tRNA(Pro) deacylase)|tara:strand:+ start:34 stop:393 length:360 start_codon:yes stop_codon:yes gene_type:complete
MVKAIAIVKSLLFKNVESNEYYLCLVSGDQYISLNKLSKIIGNKIIKANADECKEVTGFSIGGVPPVAHIHSPSRIFIDEKLNRFNKVYAAAGHPYVVFEITFEQLYQISKGNIVDFIE